MDKEHTLEEKMAHNLSVIYPMVEKTFSRVMSENSYPRDETALMIIDEYFKNLGLDMKMNKGLAQVLYALLCVEKLQLKDIVIIVTKDKYGNAIAGDYTMPDWVPDKYVGKSAVSEEFRENV